MENKLYRIKPLEWDDINSRTRFGYYEYCFSNDLIYVGMYNSDIKYLGVFPSLSEAKEAAQKHYESIVESLLVEVERPNYKHKDLLINFIDINREGHSPEYIWKLTELIKSF